MGARVEGAGAGTVGVCTSKSKSGMQEEGGNPSCHSFACFRLLPSFAKMDSHNASKHLTSYNGSDDAQDTDPPQDEVRSCGHQTVNTSHMMSARIFFSLPHGECGSSAETPPPNGTALPQPLVSPAP